MKILSLEGGGVRGLLAVLILKEIEKITGKRIYQLFDIVTGTSTGGLIAAALTASKFGYEPTLRISDLEDIYMNRTIEIFPKLSWWEKLRSAFRPKYSTDGLEKVLKEYLSNLRLSHTLLPIVVPSYDLIENQPLFFKTRYTDNPARDLLLVDMCMAAAAASTYFKPYSFEYDNRQVRCVDAGLYINNPALAPIFELSKHYQEYGLDSFEMDKTFMLSIGSGTGSEKPTYKDNAGAITMIGDIIRIVFNGQARTVEYGMSELLPKENYLRIEFKLEDSPMDDASPENIDYLSEVAEKYLDQHHAEIVNFLRNAKMV
jgi:patatin-like phospholipase/acyl hydrolase